MNDFDIDLFEGLFDDEPKKEAAPKAAAPKPQVTAPAPKKTTAKPKKETKPKAAHKAAAPKTETTKEKKPAEVKPKKLNKSEQRVKDYLDEYAKQDPVFAGKYNANGKTIKGCISYIMKEAQKHREGNMAFLDDSEVFGWAVHYFDEDTINEEGSKPIARMVTGTSPSVAESLPDDEGTDESADEKTDGDFIDIFDNI